MLRQKHGAQRFGKIAQKLLLLAFIQAGFDQWAERGVEGVDIDAGNVAGEKYAIEVKTTVREQVVLTKENTEDLQQRKIDGYVPVIAVLQIGILHDWLFSALRNEDLRPQTIPVRRLRAYPLDNLQKTVRPRFDEVVAGHFQETLLRGEDYLISVITRERGKASGE